MIKAVLAIVIVVHLLIPTAVAAGEDSRYVTDRLQLGLFEKERAAGKRIAVLSSGTRVDVLAQDGMYAKVRSPKGQTGWVKAAFLVRKPPAVVRIKTLEEEIEALKARIGKLSGGDPERIPALEAQAHSLEAEVTRLEQRLSAARDEADQLREALRAREADPALARLPVSLPVALTATIFLLLLALAFGIGLGKRMAETRVRRRLSGYRLA